MPEKILTMLLAIGAPAIFSLGFDLVTAPAVDRAKDRAAARFSRRLAPPALPALKGA